MHYLRELCPRAEEIVPGVYAGTCVESAFLISYPRAKAEHPGAVIEIQIGRDHAVLRANGEIYDPISDALGITIDYWSDAEIIEEADFSEWWTTHILGSQYHPTADFIADLMEIS